MNIEDKFKNAIYVDVETTTRAEIKNIAKDEKIKIVFLELHRASKETIQILHRSNKIIMDIKSIQRLFKEYAWDIISMLSDEILIANWYDKEDLEQILGHSLTDRQYKEIVEAWNRYAIHDQINEIIRMFVENMEEEE